MNKMLSGLALSCALLGGGCTYTAHRRAQAEGKLAEHSRAWTAAVVDALQLQPTDQRNEFTEAALAFATEDQRIEGQPVTPLPVRDLLGVQPTNMPPALVQAKQEAAREEVERRTVEARSLVSRQRQAEAKLLHLGEEFEAERNLRRVSWFKRGSLATLIVGGFIALAIFFPAVVPILGRVLAWLVGKIPSLAGGVGVVSVQAFDAVVKAIEQTRSRTPAEKLGNNLDFGTAEEDLHLNLSREMDAAHKALVRQRKSALKIHS